MLDGDYTPYNIKSFLYLPWKKQRFQIPRLYLNVHGHVRIRNLYPKDGRAKRVTSIVASGQLRAEVRSMPQKTYWPRSEPIPVSAYKYKEYLKYRKTIYTLSHEWDERDISRLTRNSLVYKDKFLIPLGHDPTTALSRLLADSFRGTNPASQPIIQKDNNCLCKQIRVPCVHVNLKIQIYNH